MRYLAAVLMLVSAPAAAEMACQGPAAQGGFLVCRIAPEAGRQVIAVNGAPVAETDSEGYAFIPFGRDHALKVRLAATPLAGGEGSSLDILLREGVWDIQRIDGLPPSKVRPRTPEEQAKVEADWLKKQAAWKHRAKGAWWLGGFAKPIENAVKTGVYGSQRILNGEARNPHLGVDYAADVGAAVKAPAAGTVVMAEPDMYFEGGLIVVDHGAGVMGVFMHLSRVDVEVGETVAKGDVIGGVGATGRATGAHLHWGLRVRGDYIDPELALAWAPDEASR